MELTAQIKQLEEQQQLRELKEISAKQGIEIEWHGRKYINFASNDYLGLADHPEIVQVAKQALDEFGVGATASRLIIGHYNLHAQLEKYLAQLKKVDQALVFPTGYMANLGIISALFGRDDVIFSDRLNHACIVDGIVLSRAKHLRYRHADMDHLEQLLKQYPTQQRKCIITDSVFSMDGDVAPLPEIVRLAKKYNALVMVDEAHGIGCFGETGMGVVEHFGLEQEIDLQMGTLSKAVGVMGGYVVGSKDLIQFLINQARSFIYTTGLPPALAAAATKSLELIVGMDEERNAYRQRIDELQDTLRAQGWNIGATNSPIIPLIVGGNKAALDLASGLRDKRLLAMAIRPPTVPVNSARVRLTITRQHTQQQLSHLLTCLTEIGKQQCLI